MSAAKLVTKNSIYGNPIPRGKECPICQKVHKNAIETVPCFKRYLWSRIKEERWSKKLAFEAGVRIEEGRTFTEQLMDLSGCSMAPSTAAHITVLKAAVKWLEPRM